MRSRLKPLSLRQRAVRGALATGRLSAQLGFGIVLGLIDTAAAYAVPAGIWRTLAWLTAISISIAAVALMEQSTKTTRKKETRRG